MHDHAYVIAVDLGGTHLRVGAVRSDGTVEEKEKQGSEARLGSTAVLGLVAQGIRRMAEKIALRRESVTGLAIGIPGIVDRAKGIVHQSPHFPDWKNLEILSFFKSEFPWPVVVDNDANMAALGEGWKGAARGLKNFVMLTFGTGIGGGIVVDGNLLHGERGFAGEVGHIVIEPEGVQCACGSKGCWEVFVSSHGILRLAEEFEDAEGREKLLERFGLAGLGRLTVRHLYEAALDGDIFSNVVFKRMGYYLGVGLSSLVNILGTETFVLGGGISEAWDFFIEPARKELSERTYREVAESVVLKKAALGDDAALAGGASIFFHPQEK